MQLAPTPRDTVMQDGSARLYRFRRPENRPAAGGKGRGGLPVLLVPSLINRWYVLDLREGVSLAAALVAKGLDVWCLDWGAAAPEDRYLTWDDVVARLARAVRRVRRETEAEKVGMLGYCIGGTLAGIHAALEPDSVAALVNLAGPFDFAEGGFLADMVKRRFFDADAVAAAGNVSADQMQSGFSMLRPTLSISKWVNMAYRAHDPEFMTAFKALEEWSSDNIDFPAAAYATYIRELYQENLLVKGEHYVGGRRVDLGDITCPVLTVSTDRDTICPPAAARALNGLVGSKSKEFLAIPGGHVGAVVGGKASTNLYPVLGDWFRRQLCN
jgi:polyhydroxyalkanoate synthase